MNLKKDEIIELIICDLAFGGAGVGKISQEKNEDNSDGNFVIFVDGCVPGDKIEARITKIKKQYGEAKLEKIITPSPDRTAPRCRHFGNCGGCGLQFLAYDQQLIWKEKMVRDAITKIGGFKNAADLVAPIIGCESPWFYRNKMEYSFGGGAGEGLKLGLHPPKCYWDVFNLEECFLESESSANIVKSVCEWCAEKKLTAFNPQTNTGLLRNLIIREGKNTNEIMVNLVINGNNFAHSDEFTKWIMGKFPAITSLYHTSITIQRGHRTIIQEFNLAGKKTLTEILSVNIDGKKIDLKFEILPQAFFQPNTIQAQTLYGKILEFAGSAGKDTYVLDLFCGTGTIGMFLAISDNKVIGIDLNESAIKNAEENTKLNGITNIAFKCGDVFNFPLLSASLLITDPPRAGLAPKTLEKIIAAKIPRWIYVSCNPASLARDLKIACASGYKLKKIQPVDMFPQTYHVESVVLLEL